MRQSKNEKLHKHKFGELFFHPVGGVRRLCLLQLDGSLALADECTCPPPVANRGCVLVPSMDCPLDLHKVRARRRLLEHIG
jgi:hypothetical protein